MKYENGKMGWPQKHRKTGGREREVVIVLKAGEMRCERHVNKIILGE